jgi:hypothetical protein
VRHDRATPHEIDEEAARRARARRGAELLSEEFVFVKYVRGSESNCQQDSCKM